MPGFKLSAKAEHDLEDIIDFTLSRWGVDQAMKYVDGFEELARMLARTPALGKSRDDLHKGLLAFPYESHLLFYVKDRQNITIVRILHESMSTSRHF